MLAALTAVSMLTGCSDTRNRQANRDLQRQAETSRRLCDRAAGMLASPVFSYDGRNMPLVAQPTSAEASKVTLSPPGQLNPDVLATIEKATNDLGAALAANPEADKHVISMAQQVLAQLAALKGEYYAAAAAARWTQLAGLMDKAEDSASLLASESGLRGFYDKLAAASPAELKAMGDKNAADAKAASAKAAELGRQIATAEGELKSAIDKQNAAAAKASELALKAEAATADEALPIAAEAARFRKESDAMSAVVMERTTRLQTLKEQKSAGDVVLKQLSLQGSIIADALKSRDGSQKNTSGTKSALDQVIAAERGRLSELLASIAKEYAAIAAAEKGGVDSFAAAAGFAKQASASAGEGMQNRRSLTQMGMLHARSGDLHSAAMLRQAHLDAMLSRTATAWQKLGAEGAPDGIAQSRALMVPADKRRSSAADDYKEAVNCFQVASGSGAEAWTAKAKLVTAKLSYASVTDGGERSAALEDAQRICKDLAAMREGDPLTAQLSAAIARASGTAALPSGGAQPPSTAPAEN
jgi:hypothetical protein